MKFTLIILSITILLSCTKIGFIKKEYHCEIHFAGGWFEANINKNIIKSCSHSPSGDINCVEKDLDGKTKEDWLNYYLSEGYECE